MPVISIFGTMYLGVKHMVDRYNLYFAFLPSRISKRIHDRAVEITLMGKFCKIWIFTRDYFDSMIFVLQTTWATRFGLIFLLFFTLLRYDKGNFYHYIMKRWIASDATKDRFLKLPKIVIVNYIFKGFTR